MKPIFKNQQIERINLYLKPCSLPYRNGIWYLQVQLLWTDDETSTRRFNGRVVRELCWTELHCTFLSMPWPPKSQDKQEQIQSLCDGICDIPVNSDCLSLTCTTCFLQLAFYFQINHYNFQHLFYSSDFIKHKEDG